MDESNLQSGENSGPQIAKGPTRRVSPHASRRYGSRTSRKIFRLRLAIGALSVLLVTMAIGWILTGARLSQISEKYYKEQVSSRIEGDSAPDLQARIDELEKQNEILVLGRVPGLQLLEYDKTIDINQEYLRNISFTLTGTAYSRNYEYRAVLHNDSLNVQQPLVRIYLFDERGVQIGRARLTKEDATSKAESENLQPDETRSYTGSVELNLDAEPHYFLVTVE